MVGIEAALVAAVALLAAIALAVRLDGLRAEEGVEVELQRAQLGALAIITGLDGLGALLGALAVEVLGGVEALGGDDGVATALAALPPLNVLGALPAASRWSYVYGQGRGMP